MNPYGAQTHFENEKWRKTFTKNKVILHHKLETILHAAETHTRVHQTVPVEKRRCGLAAVETRTVTTSQCRGSKHGATVRCIDRASARQRNLQTIFNVCDISHLVHSSKNPLPDYNVLKEHGECCLISRSYLATTRPEAALFKASAVDVADEVRAILLIFKRFRLRRPKTADAARYHSLHLQSLIGRSYDGAVFTITKLTDANRYVNKN